MALDNLHCPQFVDFTNNATFDMFDGADHFFEKGVVGELGLGFEDNINNKDGIDELIAALNSGTNLNQKSTNDKKDSGISEALSISPSNQALTTGTTKQSKLQQNKKTSKKQRTNSTTSLNKQQQAPTASTNTTSKSTQQNIVKKTIAKVKTAFKANKQTSGESASQVKPKTKQTGNDTKKKNDCGPVKVEHNQQHQQHEIINASSEVNSSNNRRCSSVPRTLKEKQELSNKQVTLGEKIQNFFSRDAYKTLSKKSQKAPILETNEQAKNDESVKKPINRVALSDKSPNALHKPRQRSVDRKDPPQVALPYQGVKFIPKQTLKYTPVEPFSNARTNKTNTSLVEKKPVGGASSSRLNNSINSTAKPTNSNKENSVCLNVSASQDTSTLQNSICDNRTANTSTMSNCSRKNVKPPMLHTETRAQQRHKFDSYLKDKERMAEMIKKNLAMQKEIEDKNEIRKLRAQLNFKSKPFKEMRPMEIKPSEKPLTDPKSPEFASKSTTFTKALSTDNLSKL